MNCPIKTQENREWLVEYSAGRLDRERAVMVERHVEACPACARFVEEQRIVWNALGQWDAPELSADFNRRLYQRVDRAQPSSWLQRFWRPLVPVAALCLLIVAGVVLRAPIAGLNPAPSRGESVEPEQVERTLDDLQMLREMALTPSQEAGTTQPM
ncbi:MAG TPA: zf-HC2 domain-containing protein [Bryobacteraceae bacterium]|nr:zf-HC2 domain-containing protein [Bryobacteraceae bacterium]